MNNKIFDWRQTINYLGGSCFDQKDLSSLLIYTRKNSIGKAISYQKTSYTDQDLDKLKIIIEWWRFLNDVTCDEWRSKETAVAIQNIIAYSVSHGEPLTLYSIFCPSYKKGLGAYGYTGKIGVHTQTVIEHFSDFVITSEKIGIKLVPVVYFSDLLLENYEKLQETNYKQDLENNFLDFKQKFIKQSGNRVIVKRLSSVKAFKEEIGERGISTGQNNLPEDIYQRVLLRNRVFYKNFLGWNEDQIKNRTDVLIGSYEKMGQEFRKMFPLGIMYWVESAYERGSMYSGKDQANPIPIIYPRKNE